MLFRAAQMPLSSRCVPIFVFEFDASLFAFRLLIPALLVLSQLLPEIRKLKWRNRFRIYPGK